MPHQINYVVCGKQPKVAALDTQIDKAVYKLYGLTEEEIKVVEGEK
jgi:hypothetical protein